MEETMNGICTEPTRATSGKYGILVADDEEGVRGVLDIGMRQQGFDVWLAADGREALDLYRRHGEAIDVVLLDVRMPGQDGPQTLAALQQLNPRVRCCFMSGDFDCYNEGGRGYTEKKLRDLGAAGVLPKPFRLDEIAQLLWQLASKADLSPSIP
jgi:CheY-like chemotaxis protein